MRTAIVALKPGWLAKTEDGWILYEVDKNLIFDVKKFPSITDLQNCRTLDDVRKLVGNAV